MTKDEMVQKIYIRYLTEDSSCSPKNERDALAFAKQEAEYFFKNYRPKKKREVVFAEAEYFDVNNIKTIDIDSEHPGYVGVPLDWFVGNNIIYKALKAGRSVRVK